MSAHELETILGAVMVALGSVGLIAGTIATARGGKR